MRVLTVKPGSIADIVPALTGFSAIPKAMPRTQICWVVEPESVRIFRDNPLLDRLIEVVTKALRRGLVSGETLRAPRQQLRQLRASAFDLTSDFQLLLKSASIARPSGARCIFSLRDSLKAPGRPHSAVKPSPLSINLHSIRKTVSVWVSGM